MNPLTRAALGGLFLLLCLVGASGAAQQVLVRQHTFSADGTWTLSPTRHTRRASLDCRGTWGGGTLGAQVSVDGTNFVPALEGTDPISCADDCARQLLDGQGGPFAAIRLSLSGATAPLVACVVLLAEEEGR